MPPEASVELLAALNYPYGPRKQSQGYGYRWDLHNPILRATFHDYQAGEPDKSRGPIILMKFPIWTQWYEGISPVACFIAAVTTLFHPYPDAFHDGKYPDYPPAVYWYRTTPAVSSLNCSAKPFM